MKSPSTWQSWGLIPGSNRPEFLMAIIQRPDQCSTRFTFEKLLYSAKQLTRSKLREAGIMKQFFFTSLSSGTIVYKALTPSSKLAELYPDLQSSAFKTRFVLFHRRFSTNTATAWDTAQPFRVVAHNGEINTISGNRAWAFAREKALGLREDELLTHRGISDSGSVNEMIEALLCRSSIPHPEDTLAILMPQADNPHSFYKFWSRAMEPWDGPGAVHLLRWPHRRCASGPERLQAMPMGKNRATFLFVFRGRLLRNPGRRHSLQGLSVGRIFGQRHP